VSGVSSYKDLKVWQKGIDIVKLIYTICASMPKDEIYGLQAQLKRAAVSVPSNIAEGYGRNYSKSFIQFLKISRGSLLELETQIIIGFELEMIDESNYSKIIDLITEENKMLNAFIKSIENTIIA
jgi:four helix bundle protein